jgi:hypothetical protein
LLGGIENSGPAATLKLAKSIACGLKIKKENGIKARAKRFRIVA